MAASSLLPFKISRNSSTEATTATPPPRLSRRGFINNAANIENGILRRNEQCQLRQLGISQKHDRVPAIGLAERIERTILLAALLENIKRRLKISCSEFDFFCKALGRQIIEIATHGGLLQFDQALTDAPLDMPVDHANRNSDRLRETLLRNCRIPSDLSQELARDILV